METFIENLRTLLSESDPNRFVQKSITDPQTGATIQLMSYAELLDTYEKALAFNARETVKFRPIRLGRGSRGGV